MDLGIKGKKAIVCASSRGLGKGCAVALAHEGVELTINGRNEKTTLATADELRALGAKVAVVLGDVSEAEIQEELLAACPSPDNTAGSQT